jgi:hypothetical protein
MIVRQRASGALAGVRPLCTRLLGSPEGEPCRAYIVCSIAQLLQVTEVILSGHGCCRRAVYSADGER